MKPGTICSEAQTLTKRQSSFKVQFVMPLLLFSK